MGLLTKLLRIAHPVRSAKRSAKRAITPKPIRRALSIKNTVAHPLSTIEYKAIGAVDRAITPRSRKQRNVGCGIALVVVLVLAAIGWAMVLTVNYPVVMWPIWGLVAVLAILYPIGRWRLRKQAKAAQQVANRHLHDHFSPDGLSFKASDGQWYSTDGGHRWDGQAWQPRRPGPCAHCGATDQTRGQPCRYCGKTA